MSSLSGDRRDRADAIAHHHVTALENAEASGHCDARSFGAQPRTLLQAAAERAGSLHSHAAAARLWGQALQLCTPDDESRPMLLLAYGKALAVADEPAVQMLDEAAGALIAADELVAAAEAESTLAGCCRSRVSRKRHAPGTSARSSC